jgi:hypothetical protein
MTFVITEYLREGIVMASDSRLILNVSQQQGEGQATIRLAVGQSDANYYLFLAPNGIGIASFGAPEVEGNPIAGAIEAFIREKMLYVSRPVEVDEVPELLVKYLRRMPTQPETGFHIAGYKSVGNQRVQQVWHVHGKTGDITLVNQGHNQGATWGGESDILARLVQPVWVKDGEENFKQLPSYTIPWQFFTLQDGIDFAVYALRTTIDSLRFQPRPKTVGGPIDVLVIMPDRAFWVQRKELHIS